MKISFRYAIILLTVVFFCTGNSFAKTYSYPPDEPAVSITFPDNWEVKRDPEYSKGLIALSEDEEIEIDVWVLEEQEVTDDLIGALQEAGEEVSTIIKEWVTDFEVEEHTTGDINGITFHQLSGTGQDKEDDSEIEVAVTFFSPDKKHIFVLMYWGSEEAEKTHAEELKAISNSLEAVK